MTKASFQSPRLLTIGLGIAVFVLLLIALCSLSRGIKGAGSVLLFIPERLVHTVHPAEVFEFDRNRSPSQVAFTRGGLYQVYTSDDDLLVISDQLAQSDAPPWITIAKAGSDAPVVGHVHHAGVAPVRYPACLRTSRARSPDP
jgi:hypothetical protein